ncbi:Hypothetical protein PBC10988_24160 [Planctomycetales bacterium 10988]|nr:Hypothetical protein PBC10988_24160 [Planctomycetales bacterium 10988]
MKVSLTVLGGKNDRRVVDLQTTETLFGREDKCHVQVKSDEVSREHCLLILDEKHVILRDLQSSNGTFVNQRKMRGEIELEDGDTIQVGPQLFSVGIERDEDDHPDTDILSDLNEKEEAPANDKTAVGKLRAIDPGELEDLEADRLQERLNRL